MIIKFWHRAKFILLCFAIILSGFLGWQDLIGKSFAATKFRLPLPAPKLATTLTNTSLNLNYKTIITLAYDDYGGKSYSCPSGFVNAGYFKTDTISKDGGFSGIVSPSSFNEWYYDWKSGLKPSQTNILGIESGWLQLCVDKSSQNYVLSRMYDDYAKQSYSCSSDYPYHLGAFKIDTTANNLNYPSGVDYAGNKLNAGWFQLCGKEKNSYLEVQADDYGGNYNVKSCLNGYYDAGWFKPDPSVQGGGIVAKTVTGNTLNSGWLKMCSKLITSATTTSNFVEVGDNSLDADGFLWGTETYPAVADASQLSTSINKMIYAVNSILNTKYVKFRLMISNCSRDGKDFFVDCAAPALSDPNPQDKFNLDETAKVFKDNGWSMVPMLSPEMPSKGPFTDQNATDYVNFAKWFIDKYKVAANIKYIELVNAPSSTELIGLTGEQLVKMNNDIYDYIKSKHSDVMVGTPGFEYMLDSSLDGTMPFEYFLDKANGAKFDFWAFHGYPAVPSGGTGMDVFKYNKYPYPPTKIAKYNKYTGIPGITEIRKKLDANGWANRLIIDAEHYGVDAPDSPTCKSFPQSYDDKNAAFVLQELILKRTLKVNSKLVLSGIIPMKVGPRGNPGDYSCGALKNDGTPTKPLSAVGLLLSKLNTYKYSAHISGAFDDENQVWVEKFISGDNKDLYMFFKPFKCEIVDNNNDCGIVNLDDSNILQYSLQLKSIPAVITLTDIDGVSSSISPVSNTVTLDAINSPKFLEIQY